MPFGLTPFLVWYREYERAVRNAAEVLKRDNASPRVSLPQLCRLDEALVAAEDLQLEPRVQKLLEHQLKQVRDPLLNLLVAVDGQATRNLLDHPATEQLIDAFEDTSLFLKDIKTLAVGQSARGRSKHDDEEKAKVAEKVLSIFTNGLIDKKFDRITAIVLGAKKSVNEKLQLINRLVPFPPTASADQLAKLLGVTKQAVWNSEWWTDNRKGKMEETIKGRRDRHRERAAQIEREHPRG